MGWIARLSNGDTITEKSFLAEGKRYEHLSLEDVVSLQVLYRGNYITVTRANDTQRLIQQKMQRTTTGSDELPDGHELKNRTHVTTEIFCVSNSNGNAYGWVIDYEKNRIFPATFNVVEMRINFEMFNLDLDSIEDGFPDVFISPMMRVNESDFAIR